MACSRRDAAQKSCASTKAIAKTSLDPTKTFSHFDVPKRQSGGLSKYFINNTFDGRSLKESVSRAKVLSTIDSIKVEIGSSDEDIGRDFFLALVNTMMFNKEDGPELTTALLKGLYSAVHSTETLLRFNPRALGNTLMPVEVFWLGIHANAKRLKGDDSLKYQWLPSFRSAVDDRQEADSATGTYFEIRRLKTDFFNGVFVFSFPRAKAQYSFEQGDSGALLSALGAPLATLAAVRTEKTGFKWEATEGVVLSPLPGGSDIEDKALKTADTSGGTETPGQVAVQDGKGANASSKSGKGGAETVATRDAVCKD